MYYVSLELDGYPYGEPREFEDLEEAQEYAEDLRAGISIKIEDEEGEWY